MYVWGENLRLKKLFYKNEKEPQTILHIIFKKIRPTILSNVVDSLSLPCLKDLKLKCIVYFYDLSLTFET